MAQPAPGVTAADGPQPPALRWVVPLYLGLVWTLVPASALGPLPSPIEPAGLLLFAWAIWRAPRHPELARATALVVGLLALALLAGWSGSKLWLDAPLEQLRELGFLVIAALGLASVGAVDRTVRVLAVTGLLLGLGALYSVQVEATTLFPVETDPFGIEAPRAVGPFGEANFFALSLAALVPMQYFAAARGGWWLLIGSSGLVATLGGILATGSRGGLGAALVGLALSVVFTGTLGHQRRTLRLAALGALAVAVLLAPTLSAQLEDSARRTVSGRATENRIAFAMFADHPVTGVGPGAYPLLYRDYAREIGDDPRPLREPHNLYLQIMSEQGLAGVLGWLGAAIIVGRAVVRRRVWRSATGQAVLFSMVTFLAGSLFLHGSTLRLLFILTGMALALAFATRRETEATP